MQSVHNGQQGGSQRVGTGEEGSFRQGLKAVLWASADKLRAQMDAAESMHRVLGLIFLRSISDTFAEPCSKVTTLPITQQLGELVDRTTGRSGNQIQAVVADALAKSFAGADTEETRFPLGDAAVRR